MGAGKLQQIKDINKELEAVYKSVFEWLKFAEAKNGALVGVTGVFCVNLVKYIFDYKVYENFWVSAYLLPLLLFASSSMIMALLSFVPQTKIGWIWGRLTSSNRNNVLFFGEIRNLSPEQYLEQFLSALGQEKRDFSQFERDYANQIVVNSTICYKKYNFFRLGIWLLLCGIITPIFGILLYLLIDPNANS